MALIATFSSPSPRRWSMSRRRASGMGTSRTSCPTRTRPLIRTRPLRRELSSSFPGHIGIRERIAGIGLAEPAVVVLMGRRARAAVRHAAVARHLGVVRS